MSKHREISKNLLAGLLLAALPTLLSAGPAAFAEPSKPGDKVLTSNYLVNPQGCMGLGDTPETDAIVVILTFDQVGKVTDDGRLEVPPGSDYAYLRCSEKPRLEACASKRGIFEIQDGGPIGAPEGMSFSCVE